MRSVGVLRMNLDIINFLQSITCVTERHNQRYIQSTVYIVYLNLTGIDCVESKLVFGDFFFNNKIFTHTSYHCQLGGILIVIN